MKPDRYEVSTAGRRRITGCIKQRAAKTGLSTAGSFLFGIPFVGAGAFIVLVGLRIVPVDPGSVHAPWWVLAVAGGVFCLGGFIVWSMAFKQLAADLNRNRARQDHPNEPAFADYKWNPREFRVLGWSEATKAFGIALGLSVFLSIFNWWAFFANGPLLVKIIVGIFDLFLLAAWWQTMRQIGSAFKFGDSRVLFARFPYRTEEPVRIRWQPGRGVNQVCKGTFTLRCVEEWIESRGSGKNRHVSVIQEEVWSASWIVEQSRNFLLGDQVDLVYELPPEAPSTCLSATRALFWELAVNLELPGLDFKESYLVPVYASVPAPRLKP